MAIDKLSINDLLIDNVPGAPPPEDTPNQEPIDPQQPDLTCTPDPTKTKAYRQVVGVENVGGTAYGKATGLYNKHRKYSEQWNPWHPFRSAHNFQQAQSLSQQTKTWIDQHPRRGLDNYKSNHSNQQVPYQSSSQNSNLGSTMIVGLKMIHISSEHYTTGIFSNVSSSFWHISHFRRTSILNRCASLTLRAVEFTAR